MVERRTHSRILSEVWNRKPGTLIQKRGVQASGDFKGHLVTKKVKTYNLNTVELVVIKNVTSHVQVLDMVLSKTFKVRVTCMGNGSALPTKEI